MKNKHERKIENYKIEQLEIRQEPSSNADNDNHNQYHNTRKEALGPNTKR